MSVVIQYRTANGDFGTWVTDQDRLDHILDVCEAKDLEVLEIDYLH